MVQMNSVVKGDENNKKIGWALPLAVSFFVLMILAAYSCPVDFFTHRRTMEKAPLFLNKT